MTLFDLREFFKDLDEEYDECEIQIATYGNNVDLNNIYYSSELNKFVLDFDKVGT